MYMMLAHGTISAMLFMIVGVIYDRAHHRDIDRFGGLAWMMPKYAVLASFAFFASLGLPACPASLPRSRPSWGPSRSRIHGFQLFAVISLLGVVITAGYYLITLQKVFLGDTPEVYKDAKLFPDVTKRELLVLVPLALVTIYMGLFPTTVMDMYATVRRGRSFRRCSARSRTWEAARERLRRHPPRRDPRSRGPRRDRDGPPGPRTPHGGPGLRGAARARRCRRRRLDRAPRRRG